MFKFAGAVIDFYDDPEFHENSDAQDLLGKVLVAPEKTYSLPDSAFAVKVATAAGTHRKFPIYNGAATGLSGQYFDKIASRLPENIRNAAGFILKEAHAQYGITLPPALDQEFEIPESQIIDYTPEPEIAPVTKGQLVKIAEYAFMDQNRSMHVLEKVEKATHIQKVAAQCGEPITEQEVWDYVPKGGFGPLLKEALVQRESIVSTDPELRAAFSSLMDEFPTLGPEVAPFLLHEFDKMAQLDSRYALGEVTDPFMAAWGGSTLPAKQAQVVQDLLEYKLATIARHKDMLLTALPEKFVSRFVQDPKGIYGEATPGQKKLLDFLMKKIPSNIPEDKVDSTESGRGSDLWKQVRSAEKTLKKEQVKPSDRPDRSGFLGGSISSKINEGL